MKDEEEVKQRIKETNTKEMHYEAEPKYCSTSSVRLDGPLGLGRVHGAQQTQRNGEVSTGFYVHPSKLIP